MTLEPLAFMAPGKIGRLVLKNRLVRAATSETMATDDGDATEELVRLYSDLARGGAGLIITGHIYVEPRGQYEPRQLELDKDSRIAPLARITEAVHRHGGVIFAELSHAGSQSLIPEIVPLAPSIVPNAIFARPPFEMTDGDVENVIADFGAAAARAQRAGFDGIHLHSGNGYLLSQFNSPFSNRREDRWGGDAQKRERFILEVFRAVRHATGPDFPISARLGVVEYMKDGPEGATVLSALEQVEVGVDEDGDAITSCIVVPIEGQPAPAVKTKRRLSPAQQLALAALPEAILEHGEPAPSGLQLPASITKVVTLEHWRDRLRDRGIIADDDTNPRQTFKRMREALQCKGLIGCTDKLVWPAA